MIWDWPVMWQAYNEYMYWIRTLYMCMLHTHYLYVYNTSVCAKCTQMHALPAVLQSRNAALEPSWSSWVSFGSWTRQDAWGHPSLWGSHGLGGFRNSNVFISNPKLASIRRRNWNRHSHTVCMHTCSTISNNARCVHACIQHTHEHIRMYIFTTQTSILYMNTALT